MKFRHAAALALVGWYLITPPFSTRPTRIYKNAPVSQWRYTAFDTADECNNTQTAGLNLWEQHLKKASDKAEAQMAQMQLDLWEASQCIASDDPRLKKSSK